MPHAYSSLPMLGAVSTAMVGGILIVYAPTWHHQGSPEKVTFFFLVGIALVAAGILIFVSNQ